MTAILKGPISLNEVATFIESVTKAWYGKEDVRGYFSALNSKIWFWGTNAILHEDTFRWLSSGQNGVQILYSQLVRAELGEQLRANVGKFVANVDAFSDRSFNFSTKIINKTLLEDLTKGMTFPATINEYVIHTHPCQENYSYLNSFKKYKGEMVRQANERINQSITGAAYQIIKDLR